MKRIGKIFSIICIVAIICIHTLQFYQTMTKNEVDYEALHHSLAVSERAANIQDGFTLPSDFTDLDSEQLAEVINSANEAFASQSN